MILFAEFAALTFAEFATETFLNEVMKSVAEGLELDFVDYLIDKSVLQEQAGLA